MEVMSSCKDIGTGESHKTELRAIGPPSDGFYVDLDVDEWLATQVVIMAMEGPM